MWQREARAPKRSSDSDRGPTHRWTVPQAVLDELSRMAGSKRGPELAARLAEATHLFEKERLADARRMLRALVQEVPDSAAVREVYGLVLYRGGQWASAARELEAYRSLTGSVTQNPVLADCYRALRRYRAAGDRWEELRLASPSADLVAEGRIVAAGCLADKGDLGGAIALLERPVRRVTRPGGRHLRQWYVLADLYERSGDVARARALFTRVAEADPEAFDVQERIEALH